MPLLVMPSLVMLLSAMLLLAMSLLAMPSFVMLLSAMLLLAMSLLAVPLLSITFHWKITFRLGVIVAFIVLLIIYGRRLFRNEFSYYFP